MKNGSIICAIFILPLFGLIACSPQQSNQDTSPPAQLIDDSNRALIGTEHSGSVIFYSPGQSPEQATKPPLTAIPKNDIVTRMDPPTLTPPTSFTEFLVTDGKTPELLFDNGAGVIFTQEDGEGWFCQPGDRLDYAFEKYPSSVVEEQTMAIGIIKDGVLYESDAVSDLSGHYSVDIEDAGEYYIYLIGASSEYLVLKEGCITKS